MQIDQLCSEYVASNERIQSLDTVRMLRVVARHFAKFLERQALASDLTDDQIKRYGIARRQAGLALATIDGELAKLVALKRYAAQRGLVDHPIMRVAKNQAPTPVAFFRWQIRRLWKEASRSQSVIGGVPGCIYWPALLNLIWDSGERIRAVHRLNRNDIDLRGRWVTFRERKGNGKSLVKKVRRSTARSLRKLMKCNKGDQPFAVVCLGTIYNQYETLLEDADLPTDRRSKFHCLRKSHASYLHAAGGDSRASLGHSTEAITVRHYHDPRIVQSVQPIDLLFNPLGMWDRCLSWLGW